MRNFFKYLGLIILSVIIFTGAAYGSYEFLKETETSVNTEQLFRYDNSSDGYLLLNAKSNIVFEMESTQREFEDAFIITDENGQVQKTEIKKISNTYFRILPPNEGYSPGSTYTLELKEYTAFLLPEMRKIKQLSFTIDRADEATYQFSDSVLAINKSEIELDENSRIDLKDIEARVGQILLTKDASDNYDAFKIESIDDEGLASYSLPGVDEIYSELNIKGTFSWNIDDIITNPEIETNIISSVRDSGLLESLMMISYADERVSDAEVTASLREVDDSTIEVEIEITLLPGDGGLLGQSTLKNQKIIVTINKTICLKTDIDIKNIGNFSINLDLSGATKFSIALEPFTKSGDLDLVEYLRENKRYDRFKVVDLVDKLNGLLDDHLGKQISLFNVKIPINVPGIYLKAEIFLFAEVEAAVDLTFETRSNYGVNAGISYKDEKFKTFSNHVKSTNENALTVHGKVESNAGVKVEFGAVIINEKFSEIKIDPQIGIYVDGFATFPVTSSELKILDYFYAETGFYYSAEASAYLNLLFKNIDYTQEIFEVKLPIFHLGKSILNLSMTPNSRSHRAMGDTIAIPTILLKTYDVKERELVSEPIDPKKLKFFFDNKPLKLTNNKLNLPNFTDKSSYYITAKYDTDKNETMSALVNIVISGSEIEGKVSFQMDGQTTIPVENAKVNLYDYNTRVVLNSAMTDEQGDFAFRVSEGKYFLQISARGYKELTTVQEVKKDENKYTEHLLLMDTTQVGQGKVAGTIVDAINGRAVSGVSLKVRENWNTTEGNYFNSGAYTTDGSGRYTISDLPVGYYTIEAQKDGYYIGYYNVLLKSNNQILDNNFNISPILPENQIRVVLRWGSTPHDLDSHMIGRNPNQSVYDVYYNNKSHRFNNIEVANLDVDDTTSYGPETVTIMDPGVAFVYAVHDYSNQSATSSTKMSYSGATITVFMGGREIEKFNIPVDQVGTYWTVFRYSNNKITPVNVISNEKPQP